MTTRKPRVLMVAFEFPPSNGGSIQRILSIYRGFLQAGWDVDVITASPMAYANVQTPDPDAMPSNPNGNVVRAPALDVLRHLSWKGKHFSSMIRPDRWGMTWIPSALFLGKRLVKHNKPDLVWSSAPTPSPHIIAKKLSEYAKAPWVADYRDPLPYMHHPTRTSLDVMHEHIDMETHQAANLITYATAQNAENYGRKIPDCQPKQRVMPNGFDGDALARSQHRVAAGKAEQSPFSNDKFSLYYAGVLYAPGRDPDAVFEAISMWRKDRGDTLELIFQGSGDGNEFQSRLQELGIADMVKFEAGVPSHQALDNLMRADALLLIQDERFNAQVPGKLYEYLASQKKLLLKTPGNSATAREAKSHEWVWFGSEKDSIYGNLCDIVRKNNVSNMSLRDVSAHSRQHHAEKLISWCNDLL